MAAELSIAALLEKSRPIAPARITIARGQSADGLRPGGRGLRGCWLETFAQTSAQTNAQTNSHTRCRTRHDLSLFDLSAPRAEPMGAERVKLIYRCKQPYDRAEVQAEAFLTLYADTGAAVFGRG